MLNAIQLFGVVLLGGLAMGELSRRLLCLPRTSGYVAFGLIVGQSGLGWVTPFHIESAQLLIDLALGLILFELGYHVPPVPRNEGWHRLWSGLVISLVTGAAIASILMAWGFSSVSAAFSAALCLATSPAITIATCSDVGAKGDKTGLLFTVVATNGCVAFLAVALLNPFLAMHETVHGFPAVWEATQKLCGSVILGAACAGLTLLSAEWLGRRPEHQHLLLLGTIVLGVGTAIYFDISVLLPMLLFGFITRALDRDKQVVPIRIANDARIFLVITFVLAGAALDVGLLAQYWPAAAGIAIARFLGQTLAVIGNKKRLGLTTKSSLYLAIGLQPMSSVALVLLANMQTLYSDLDPALTGTLLATILLMQLLGPIATQASIKGFGEATRLRPECLAEAKPAST